MKPSRYPYVFQPGRAISPLRWQFALCPILCSIAFLIACGRVGADQYSSTPSVEPRSSSSSSLDKVITCDSIERNGAIEQMPDWELKDIASGSGLPQEYYQRKLVKPNFCRPVSGVWTFPESSQQFFDTSQALYKTRHLSASEIAEVEKLKNSLAALDRYLVKWTISNGQLVVFEMRPNGIAMDDNFPYQSLQAKNIVINAGTGEPITLPGEFVQRSH